MLQIIAAPTARPDGRIGLNGPERRAASLATRWANNGIDVVLAYPRRGRVWSIFCRSGLPLVDYEIGGKFDFRAVLAIRSLIERFDVDLIHTQGPGSLDAMATFAARLSGRPAVVTRPSMIEDLIISRFRKRVYQFVDSISLRFASRIVAVSAAGASHLRRIVPNAHGKVRHIYNGIDLSKFSSPNRDERITVRIGMVAQLAPNKGWFDFIEVIRRVSRETSSVRGVIVGDGPLRSEIESAIAAQGLDDVIEVVGHSDEIADTLRSLDVFLFTSYREGLSVAILEALASGLPVVATDVGGTREQVLSGVNGFLCAPGDLGSLTSCTHTLVRDPVLRSTFGRASRSLAESTFSEEAMVAGYTAVYRECVVDRR